MTSGEQAELDLLLAFTAHGMRVCARNSDDEITTELCIAAAAAGALDPALPGRRAAMHRFSGLINEKFMCMDVITGAESLLGKDPR